MKINFASKDYFRANSIHFQFYKLVLYPKNMVLTNIVRILMQLIDCIKVYCEYILNIPKQNCRLNWFTTVVCVTDSYWLFLLY